MEFDEEKFILTCLNGKVKIQDKHWKDFLSFLITNYNLNTNIEEEISNPNKKDFSDCSYINYFNLGIQVMTKPDHETIDTIFLYNNDKDKQFKKGYPGKLPFQLSFQENNVQLIKRLNKEPIKKGGGGKIPIWLEYYFTKSSELDTSQLDKYGILFNFVNSNWSDLNNPIHFITLYKL
ncbi:hypothetical protein ABK040_010508 [Willaertia magna]